MSTGTLWALCSSSALSLNSPKPRPRPCPPPPQGSSSSLSPINRKARPHVGPPFNSPPIATSFGHPPRCHAPFLRPQRPLPLPLQKALRLLSHSPYFVLISNSSTSP